MKVGFIGLGIMGASMASNLIKGGFEAVVHDIRREAAAPHLAAGATWADTPRKVAEATEVVLTHAVFSSTELRDDHNRGWNGCFDALEKVLAA